MKWLNFKGIIKADITRTFINPDEFGELHTVDGKTMRVIIDKNELIDRQIKAEGANALTAQETLIYIPAVDYGAKPKPGKLLLLDGKKQFVVVDCTDEDGIYAMTLEARRS